MWTRKISLTFVLLAFSLGSCAGKPKKEELPELEDVNSTEAELPDELKEKFKVADAKNVIEKAKEEQVRAVKEAPSKKKAPKKKAFIYPNRRPKTDPIWIGEKLEYDISYLGITAGHVVNEVLPYKSINGRKSYHIRCSARSSKVFSVFYTLNDYADTFLDFEGLFSHKFHLILNETKQKRDSLELYDSEKKETFYWSRWNHKTRGYEEKKEYNPIEAFPQDSVSSVFYIRSLPLTVGSTVRFPVVSEGKTWEAVVKVEKKETLDTVMGEVRTIKLAPQMKYRGILKQQKGNNYIWVTDDDRRMVVAMEAKVKIGAVKAVLTKVHSLGSNPN